MKRVAAGGFTIVETLIVLAVSGVLFVSLVGAVQGQQGKAQFKSSMTDVVSSIQSTADQVSSGYYPAIGASFKCEAVPGVNGTAPQIRPTFEAGKPGANDDCTLMGQAIMFGVCNIGDVEKYTIQTLVGVRRTTSNNPPANYSEAEIRVMAPGASPETALLPSGKYEQIFDSSKRSNRGVLSSSNPLLSSASVTQSVYDSFTRMNMFASVAPAPEDDGCGGTNPVGGTPNYGETKAMASGTTIKWMIYDDATDGSIPLAGVAFITSPGNQVASGGSTDPGAIQTNVVPIPCGTVPNCTISGADQPHGVDAITRTFEGNNGLNVRIQGMKLCFLSSTTDQSSLIRVGANGAENSLEMTIHNNDNCQ